MDTTAVEGQSKGERTRSVLLEAAYMQFTARGYHGTSMRTIAEAAGVAVASIYNHFSSKDAIFEAMILAYHPLVTVLPKLSVVDGENIKALLQRATAGLWQEVEQSPQIFNLLMIELIECEGRHIPNMATTILPQLMRFIEAIQRTEALRAMPPLAFAQLFLGMLFAQWFTTRLLKAAGVPASALADQQLFVDVLLHGVLSPTANTNS